MVEKTGTKPEASKLHLLSFLYRAYSSPDPKLRKEQRKSQIMRPIKITTCEIWDAVFRIAAITILISAAKVTTRDPHKMEPVDMPSDSYINII